MPYTRASASSASGSAPSDSGRSSAVARRDSARSTASADESACISPFMSTTPVVGNPIVLDAANTALTLSNVSVPRNSHAPPSSDSTNPDSAGTSAAGQSCVSTSAVLRLERLDQAVDAAIPDLLVELVAIVGDQRHAADDDVVRLPAIGRLGEAVVDGHGRPTAALDHLRLHGDVGGRRLE